MTTRRAALLNLAGVATLPILGQNPPPENYHSIRPVTKEEASVYRVVFFRPEQMETLEALTEVIIPADGHSPGAKAARVSEYIDTIVADLPEMTKKQWLEGLESVDTRAKHQFGTLYRECAPEQQIALLTEVAANEGHEVTPEEHFFAVLKRATIDGYYTSRIGLLEDLQYQGNAVIENYPACARTDS